MRDVESFQHDHVIEVIRERDELLAELKKVMSMVNGLRITLEEERMMARKRNEDQLGDIARLDAENKMLCEEVEGLGAGLGGFEKQSAKMTNHIEGLCREIEEGNKKRQALETEVQGLKVEGGKAAKLLEEQALDKAAMQQQIVEGKEKLAAVEKELAASKGEAAELRAELDKVSDFQQLLKERYPSTKKPQPGRYNTTLPPAEVAAVGAAARNNPTIKNALRRTPVDNKRAAPRDGELAAMEKFKWATPTANSQASILSRYYLK